MIKTPTKIVVTGGHATPAIAVIEEFKSRFPDWKIIYIGRRYSLEGERSQSEEARLIKKLGIPFVALTTGRLTRVWSIKTLLSLFKFPLGLLQAFWYVYWLRPTLIVSFGGYVALPVVIAGWVCRIPMVTHEQTRVPGLANRIIGRLSRRVYVSFPDQIQSFPKGKAAYTGLPIRSAIFARVAPPPWFTKSVPLIFVSGGSTGARSLNELFFPIISVLVRKYLVVHQTGRMNFEKAQSIRETLPHTLQRRYVVAPFVDSPDYSFILQNASVIVGRSGANTVGEVRAVGAVAIWIPLPWSAGGEQQANAAYHQKDGASIVLNQDDLTPSLLEEKINWVVFHACEFQKRAAAAAKTAPRDGAARMVDDLQTLVHP